MNERTLPKEADEEGIVLCTVGELRMYGLRLPNITDDMPDHLHVVFPWKNAINIATAILTSWELTPEQQSTVLKDNDRQRITDILHIDMYLDVLVPREDKLNWVLGKNKAFSDMRVVDYILEHGTEKVVGYLALHADGGGW